MKGSSSILVSGLTDSVSLTRNWWNFSSSGDFRMTFLLMFVCQANSSGYLVTQNKHE